MPTSPDHERLAAVMRAVSGGILVLDSERTIVDASDALLALTGLPRDAVLAHPISRLLPADVVDLARNGPVDVAMTADDADIPVRVTAACTSTPGDAHGDAVGGDIGETVLYVEDRRAHTEAVARADWLAEHDTLTGALNRAAASAHLAEVMRECPDSSCRAGVVLVDIDRFQQVNDRLGHDVGDAVLRAVAGRLRTIHHDSAVGRLGADEFVIITRCADQHGPDELASSILTALAEPVIVADARVHVRATVGVAVQGPAGQTADALMQQADIALHTAKASGWPVGLADQDIADRARDTLERHEHIAHLIRSRQLSLAFQPLVGRSGRVGAVEALIRAEGVGAGELLDAARQQGLLDEVGAFVISEGCRSLPALQDAAGERLVLHINVAPDQLVGDRLLPQLQMAVLANGLSPQDLCIEVTEQTALNDLSAIDALEQAGFSVSIDDFGTGYSSFSYLRDLPVRQVKIDILFLHRAVEDPASRQVLEGLVGLCRGLGLQVVCEGVETAEQRDLALSVGADVWQGYLGGRPSAAADLEVRLADWNVEQPQTTLQSQLRQLGMEDLLVFKRLGDGRYAHIGGEGRGSGWAGIVEIDLASEPFMADQLARRNRVAVAIADAVQLLGPYHARSAVVVKRDDEDALVLMGNQHDIVPLSSDDPRIDEIVDMAIAQITEVSPAKPLADELEVMEAVQELLRWTGEDVDGALRHLLAVTVESLSCDVGVAHLPGVDIVTHGIDEAMLADGRFDASQIVGWAHDLPDCVQQAGVGDLPDGWRQALDVRSWYAMPLRDGAGVVFVAHTAQRPRGFTQLCQRLGRTLVESADTLFTTALARQHMRSEITIASEQARTDALTGCPNRLAWEEALDAAAAAPASYTVGIVDLNDFKDLNDRFGHAEGDRALVRAASLLREHVASAAAGRQHMVARIGGDEFGLLVRGDDRDLRSRLRASLLGALPPADGLDLAIGLAHATSGDRVRAALEIADREMYTDKARACVQPGRHLRAVE